MKQAWTTQPTGLRLPPRKALRVGFAGGVLLLFVVIQSAGCALKAPVFKRPPEPTPTDSTSHYSEQGVASWYGAEFSKRRTASGEPYDMHAMTAAHRTLPLGTWVTVINLENRESVRVRINDRGPFVDGRIVDLSYRAAAKLGILRAGTALVEIRCPFSEALLMDRLGYWVQLGAYRERDRADRLASSLKRKYPSVQIFLRDALYRVRIGPYQEEPEANRTRDRLRASGHSAYVIRDLLPLSSSKAR